MGNRVHMLAADQSHIRAVEPTLNGASRMDEVIEGINYVWLKTPPYKGNGIARVRNMASFVRQLYFSARDFVRDFKPDVVIASSTYPMDVYAAKRIARLAGAKLVFEVHDLWPLSPMELGNMSKWHPFIMLVQAAENYAYRNADVVVSMLPKVHDYMASRGLDLKKVHIVPNGISPDEWPESSGAQLAGQASALLEIKAKGLKIVGYAGTHGVSNALDTFVDAAAAMKADSDVVFVLFGKGPEKSRLEKRARDEGLTNVVFFDPVSKQQIPALLDCFDVAYIGWNRQPLYRFGIAPNKLMDYMMAGCVVLHSVSAGNDSVGEAGCGLTVEPEDVKQVVDGLRTLLALPAGERKSMGERGRNFVLREHTYPVLAQRFLDSFAG